MSETVTRFPRRWAQSEQIGELTTTFTGDFNIAEDISGLKGVRSTFATAFNEWKDDVRYMANLAIVTNMKCWEHYGSGNEELAFFKQAAEDLPREWKTEKQSSCTPLTDTWAYELSACPDGDPDDYTVECHLASIDDQIRMDDADQAVKDAAREEVKQAMASVDGEIAVELAEVIDEHAYYLTATQIRDALHESVEKIGAMPAASPNKVVDIVDHRLSEKEEDNEVHHDDSGD